MKYRYKTAPAFLSISARFIAVIAELWALGSLRPGRRHKVSLSTGKPTS